MSGTTRRWLAAAVVTVAGGCIGHIDGGARGPGEGTGNGPPDPGGGPGSTPGGPGSTPGGPGPSQPGPATDPACSGAPGEAPPTRVRRLTKLELGYTLLDLLGVSPALAAEIEDDSRASGFSTGEERSVSIGYAEGLERVAVAAAAELRKSVASPRFAAGCFASDGAARTCAASFIDDFGRRAFRRPVEAAERTGLLAVYDAGVTLGKAGDAADRFRSGLAWIARAVLQSPDFIYRSELGGGGAGDGAVTTLTPFETAAALSYSAIASPPDAALLEAAAAGQLRDASQIAAQGQRLLAAHPDRFAANLHRFVVEWLDIDYDSPAWNKDPAAYPGFSSALKQELRRETTLFIADWAAAGPALGRLLTTPDAFVSRTNAPVYGVASAPAALARTTLDGSQRAGLLTQAGFLGSHAHTDGSSPVRRGLAVLTRVLCKSPPPVPDNVPPLPALDRQAVKTTRQRFAQHLSAPACAACHGVFEPIGNLFEGYDGLGQFRSQENGAPVDTSGALVGGGADHSDLQLASAVALGPALADSAEVHACAATQLLRYLQGRADQGYDRCALAGATRKFQEQGLDARALFLALVASSSTTTRTVRSAP
jgi:hypothetical protein